MIINDAATSVFLNLRKKQIITLSNAAKNFKIFQVMEEILSQLVLML